MADLAASGLCAAAPSAAAAVLPDVDAAALPDIDPSVFPPGAFAFVDLETTGTDPSRDRITEIGIVEVVDGIVRQRFAQLVDPGVPIPPAIQALTGITDAMVRTAPGFAALADDLAARLAGRVLVAHNARFDYGFLKAEFRRLGRRFQAEVLCTVRLSRRLYPQAARHGLDALVARHGLDGEDRHRALGDARLIARFVGRAAAEHPPGAVTRAIDELLRRTARPGHLPEDALDAITDGPGVYTFLGVSGQPLYVGKARNVAARIRQHFYDDSSNRTDGRLAAEVHGLRVEETAGELTALFREIQLIGELAPLHNRLLRRRETTVFLRLIADNRVALVPLAAFDPDDADDLYGPFGTRQSARAALAALGREHRLCDGAIGLWTGERACFSRQIGRCPGLCCGEEPPARHHERMLAALAPLRFPAWPHPGSIALTESNPDCGLTTTLHFDRWCVIDPARPFAREFHPDLYKLLRKALASGRAAGGP